MKLFRVLFFLAATLLPTRAAAPQIWRYRLIEGSQFITENLIVGGAPIVTPMRGTFDLRLISAGPFSTQYALDNVKFTAGRDDQFSGTGTYTISGDFVLHQSMTLAGDLQTATGTQFVGFTGDAAGLTRQWPMLEVTLKQTNGAPAQTYSMKIDAAPIREIWFSTATDFHSATAPPGEDRVLSGDLLSADGHIVKHNGDLQNFPGPTYENMGLDALDILPGAEIAFSTDTLGVLSDGDVAFVRKGTILHISDILKPFTSTLSSDPGLDALSFVSDTEFYFSIEQDVKATKTTLHHGDLIHVDMTAQTGDVYKSNSILLSRFHPSAVTDFGLDAVFIWPTGEIWFSTRDGFTDTQLGAIGGGDILSDQGYVVFRNLELVAPFAPIEDVNNFGLDTLTIVSDFSAATGDTTLSASILGNTVLLDWTGAGRVFQVERSSDVAGPYEPISNILPDLHLEDTVSGSKQFYRLRQW